MYAAALPLSFRCLEIIEKYGFGAAIQTKSNLILRDIDLLDSINRSAKCVVEITLTTYDEALCRIIEPNVCTTERRIEVLHEMRKRGIPTVVWLSPILPYINDTEDNITSLLRACGDAGVKGIISFGMGLTLRDGDREYYYDALDRHFPGLKERYIREYGNAYELPSPNTGRLMRIFKEYCGRNAIISTPEECFSYMNDFPENYEQIGLF